MKEWYTAGELAAADIPGLPKTKAGLLKLAQRENWDLKVAGDGRPLSRRRAGRGGGREYHVMLLDKHAQEALAERHIRENLKTCAAAKPSKERPDGADPELWAWYERQPQKAKDEAHRRLAIMREIDELRCSGLRLSVRPILENTAHRLGIGPATIWRWWRAVKLADRCDWLPLLCPRTKGKTGGSAEMSKEAWDYFRSAYLHPSKPPITSCYRQLERAAAEHGWTIPSEATVRRRVREEVWVVEEILRREGMKGLERRIPAMTRDKSMLHALQVVNADFHTMDVWVKFPELDAPQRPSVVAIQDVYSGKVLAWRVDVSPSSTAVRLCFLDLFEEYGIPDEVILDNGREFASKLITGGQPTRYRFKVKAEDCDGLLTTLGCKVHWAQPYSGRSKPIERSFRDFCDDISKCRAFAGAYTGNSPTNKPENYGSRAIDLDVFLQVLGEGIALHNARTGRRSPVCGGRLSFDQAFAASYASAPIRKARPEHLRMAMLAAQNVTARTPTGEIWVYGNRFWAAWLIGHVGAKVTARFDPDDIQAGIEVYDAAGRHLGHAECWWRGGFLDAEKARAYSRARRALLRGLKQQAEAERILSGAEFARLTPTAPNPEPVETKVIRPSVWGNTALKPEPEEAPERISGQLPDEYQENFTASLAAMRKARESGLED